MASPTASKPVAASRPRMSRVGFKTMEKVAVDSEDSDGDESVMSSWVPGSRADRDALKDSKRLGMTQLNQKSVHIINAYTAKLLME